MITHLLAQGSLTGDAESGLSELQAFLLRISNAWIVCVFVAGVLLSLLGQVLGVKLLPGANTTMGKVIILSLVAAYAVGHGPAYLAGML